MIGQLHDGASTMPKDTVIASVCVEYKHVEGWHVFSSSEMPGLYVAHRDAEAAYKDVSASIEALIRLNEGVDCTAIPQEPVSSFLKSIRARRDHVAVEDFEVPPVLHSRSYAVHACQ